MLIFISKKNKFVVLILISLLFSCSSTEKIKTGNQALERKQYALATQLLQKEFQTAKQGEKAQIAFLTGEAYRNIKQPENSIKWYLQSAHHGNRSDELYFHLASMYKNTAQYDKAIEQLEKISNQSKISPDARREKDICRQAAVWAKKEHPGLQANPITSFSQFSYLISGYDKDSNLLVSAEKRISGVMDKKHKWTGRPFFDLYYAEPEKPADLKPFQNAFNTDFHEADLSINKSNTELVFTRCAPEGPEENMCYLYLSTWQNLKWSEPVRLPFQKNQINYGHAHFSGDSILFFSSNDPSGKGGYDIYFVRKEQNGWSKPILLPEPINTPGNEMYPATKGDTLFFSSDFLPGLGGLDIFKTYILPNGSWDPPRNMMPPVNSPKDDFGFHALQSQFKISGDIAYFNSNRNNPEGIDQIYSLTRIQLPQADTSVLATEATKPKKNYKLFLSLRVFENVFEEPDNTDSQIFGKKPLNQVNGIIEQNDRSFKTDRNGKYITELEFDNNYSISLSKENYLSQIIDLNIVPYPDEGTKLENHTISKEVTMTKIELEKEIILENIFYDLDKWDIRDDALPSLNGLLTTLNANPKLKVLIGSHTDCRADEKYNLDLSEKRASSVVDFLIKSGVGESRIAYKAYGESMLLEKCPCEECSEEQHQRNRRTTFKLSK